jgi:hypothetical protein
MESKDTMLVTMTLGQLIQAITEDPAIKEMVLGMVKTVLTNNEVEQIMEENLKGKPFTVKGIQGIASIFGCSLPTALKLKKTVIKDAVMQDGRVILTEVAKAKRLYREWTEKNGTFAHLPKDE